MNNKFYPWYSMIYYPTRDDVDIWTIIGLYFIRPNDPLMWAWTNDMPTIGAKFSDWESIQIFKLFYMVSTQHPVPGYCASEYQSCPWIPRVSWVITSPWEHTGRSENKALRVPASTHNRQERSSSASQVARDHRTWAERLRALRSLINHDDVILSFLKRRPRPL